MPTGVAPKINKNSKKKKRSLHLPVNIDVILTTTGMRNSRGESLSGGAWCCVYVCGRGLGRFRGAWRGGYYIFFYHLKDYFKMYIQ